MSAMERKKERERDKELTGRQHEEGMEKTT
jgi:hypothetical protein